MLFLLLLSQKVLFKGFQQILAGFDVLDQFYFLYCLAVLVVFKLVLSDL